MSSYLDNNFQNTANEEEIELKEIFAILLRYKKSIALITFVVFIASGMYAYFKITMYQSNLTMQILKKEASESLMAQTLGTEDGDMGNEVVILRSRFLALKVLEKINLGTQYYIYKNLKAVELYKKSPFIVRTEAIKDRLIGFKIGLTPIDENNFRLTIAPTLRMKLSTTIRSFLGQVSNDKKSIYFSQVFSYGEKISNDLFTMTVIKQAKLTNNDYAFSFTPNNYMYGTITSSLGIGTGKGETSVIQLSYRDNIPQRAEKILNTLVEVYANQSIEAKNTGARKTLNFIDKQLKEINDALQDSGSNLKDYKSSHTVVNLEAKADRAAGKLDELETQIHELGIQQSVLKYLLDYLKNNRNILGIDLGSGTEISAPIATLFGTIQEAKSLYTSMQADYTEKHPSVIKVNQELASLKETLKETIKSGLRATNQRITALEKVIDKNKASLRDFPLQEQELAELKRSYSVNEGVYDYLLQKRIETAIAKSSTNSGMRVIDSAISGSNPIEPNRIILVIIGLIVGLILGIVQAFARSFIANTIQSIADIEKYTLLPLYAVLPFFKDKKSLYKDALRVLLTKLEFSESKPKIITITSSVQGEGRTTTAIEFAKVIAQSNRKVLVIDFDMRRSKIHKRFNLSNKLGISTLLSAENSLREVIQHISSNLDIIASGPIPSDPYGLIMSETLEIVMTQLRTQYHYIIIESPAAGLVADALVLMRLADLNLILFKANYSKKDFLKNTNRFVKEHRLENVGIILNGLELKKIRPWLKK